jgi:V8-like Glu-specific endopeptidase
MSVDNINLHAPVKKPQDNSTPQPLRELGKLELTTPGNRGTVPSKPSLSAERLIVRGNEPLEHFSISNFVVRKPSLLPETVIARDDRIRVVDSENYPWRMICSLEIRGPGQNAIGTGWFAGPKTIITAGHCVFDTIALGGWAREIRIYPGRYDKNFPYPQSDELTKPIVSKNFETVQAWYEQQNSDYDYGVIHLDQPVGNETGWFAVAVKDDAALKDALVNVSGYPGDRDFGKFQYFHASRIQDVTQQRFFYDVDTFGGQSGAPAWIEIENNEPQVIGIHSYGVGGSFTLNSATRITPEVFENIQRWIEANN